MFTSKLDFYAPIITRFSYFIKMFTYAIKKIRFERNLTIITENLGDILGTSQLDKTITG